MKSFVYLFVLAVLILLLAPAKLEAQGSGALTRDVEVYVYLIDIDEISSVDQSYVVNFYTEFRWNDAGLAHAGPDSISRNLQEVWHPHVQILNEQRMIRTFPQTVEIRPDGEVIYRQRVWGSLSQPLELRHFPFDTQKLELTLIAVNFGMTGVRFINDPESGISDQLTIPDWELRAWNIDIVDLPLGKQSSTVPGLVFSMDVKRHVGYFALKVILPLFLIVMMSWLVFWIDPSMAGTQISVSITAMLTLIAYRFAIGGMVPKLAFLTSLDFFVLGSTILVFICLLQVVYTSWLSSKGKLEAARAADIKARWFVPLLSVAVAIETLVLRYGF